MHKVLAEQFGRRWPRPVPRVRRRPAAAAASIGQVHRAVWARRPRGRGQGAVPGRRTRRCWPTSPSCPGSPGCSAASPPGLDVKPLLAELAGRVAEELDYALEADAQRAFAAAYADDQQIAVPRVVASAPKVLVTEWIDGTPLSTIIAGGSAGRARPGRLRCWPPLHFSRPARAGLLHADPHPGNFRLLPDGRLGVLDFGAVARLPGGLPAQPIGRLTRLALDGDAEAVLDGLRDEGFVRPERRVDAEACWTTSARCSSRCASDEFHVHPGVAARRGGPARPTRAARRPSSAGSSTCRRRTC